MSSHGEHTHSHGEPLCGRHPTGLARGSNHRRGWTRATTEAARRCPVEMTTASSSTTVPASLLGWRRWTRRREVSGFRLEGSREGGCHPCLYPDRSTAASTRGRYRASAIGAPAGEVGRVGPTCYCPSAAEGAARSV
jgi:hypothetical protein